MKSTLIILFTFFSTQIMANPTGKMTCKMLTNKLIACENSSIVCIGIGGGTYYLRESVSCLSKHRIELDKLRLEDYSKKRQDLSGDKK